MTVGTQINRVVVQGDTVTTVFSYPFLIRDATEAVLTFTSTTGNQTVLTAANYTILGLGNPTGGTVTYPLTGSPMAVGESLTIQRLLPLVQTTAISNQGPTFAAVEQALDTEEMQLQQIQDEYGRGLQFNIADAGTHLTLPPTSQLVGQLLGFDSNGDPIAAQPSSALVSSAMQPVVASSTVQSAFTTMADATAYIAGSLTVNGAVTFGSSLSASGTTVTVNNLTASGTASFRNIGSNALATLNNLSAIGATSLNTLQVVGTSTLNSIIASGTTTLADVLSSGTGTFNVLQCKSLSTGPITGAGPISTTSYFVSSGSFAGAGNGAYLAVPGVTPSTSWTAPLGGSFTSALEAPAFFTSSDRDLKEEIEDLPLRKALDWVMSARPRLFRWRSTGRPGAGFIAQEAAASGHESAVIGVPDKNPMFAKQRDDVMSGFRLSYDYNTDIAYLTAVVQHLVNRLHDMESR